MLGIRPACWFERGRDSNPTPQRQGYSTRHAFREPRSCGASVADCWGATPRCCLCPRHSMHRRKAVFALRSTMAAEIKPKARSASYCRQSLSDMQAMRGASILNVGCASRLCITISAATATAPRSGTPDHPTALRPCGSCPPCPLDPPSARPQQQPHGQRGSARTLPAPS